MGTKIMMPERSWERFSRETGRRAEVLERITRPGMEVLENGRFRVLPEGGSGPETACLVLDADDRTLWSLDSWESGLYADRYDLDGERQSYIATEIGAPLPEYAHHYSRLMDPGDIPCSDVYLLIPGRIGKHVDPARWESKIGDHFNRRITETVEAECKSRFAKDIARTCLGRVELFLAPEEEGDEPIFLQMALANLAVHRETRLCILELHVPFCDVGSNYLMNQFRQGTLLLRWQGELYREEDFAAAIGMALYGQKRCLVFAYGDLEDRQIIGALANEYAPMGEIGGRFAEKVAKENLAQYDTARVYVSTVTMIECCPMTTVSLRDRIDYQVIEIFFVELLLLNDASVDKIYADLQKLEADLRRGPCRDAAVRMEKLNRDMSQALRFSDYDQFLFPTVRESSRRIAADFGIDVIFSRYAANKAVLTAMIEADQRRSAKRENEIKNRFLFFITALSMISAVSGALEKLKLGVLSDYAYFVAIGVVAVMYGLYRLAIRMTRKKG